MERDDGTGCEEQSVPFFLSASYDTASLLFLLSWSIIIGRKRSGKAHKLCWEAERRFVMTGREIANILKERRRDEHQFVKWWRKEEDFLDYDLIDRFMDNVSSSEEIGGVDLLTMEEMWNELKRIGGTRVKLLHEKSGDKVEWVHPGKQGVHKEVCIYSPETLLTIFDVETRGNPVD